MRKRTARRLRCIADHLDPKPARWYASAWQQSANTAPAKHRNRVLADYLTTMDLKNLRP